MNKPYEFNFCIIGAGFSGTATFVALIENLVKSHCLINSVCIHVVEERHVNGPGLPYSKEEVLPNHLCNNQARKMAIKENDFVDWLSVNRERIVDNYSHLILETHPGIDPSSWEPDQNAFYPRQLFGIYLEERFAAAWELAVSNGITLNVMNGCRAIDGCKIGGKYRLVIEAKDNKKTFCIDKLDKVLLATGHWNSLGSVNIGLRNRPCYFHSPYPAKNLRRFIDNRISSQKPPVVFIQGMGPSGIDAILTTVSDDKFSFSGDGHIVGYNVDSNDYQVRIIASSRSGFFPAARGPSPSYEFKYITHETHEELSLYYGRVLDLQDLLTLVDLELKHGTGNAVGLNEVLNPNFDNAYQKLCFDLSTPTMNSIVHLIVLRARRLKFYRALAPNEKLYYDRVLDSHFIRTAVPIPLINAEKLKALGEAGILECIKLGYDSTQTMEYSLLNDKIVVTGGEPESTHYCDIFVKASGQNFNISEHPSSLVGALVRRGEIVPHKEGDYTPGGLMLDGFETYRAVRVDDRNKCGGSGHKFCASEHLYSMGVPTRFWQNERNFADAIISASNWIASDWTKFILSICEESSFTALASSK